MFLKRKRLSDTIEQMFDFERSDNMDFHGFTNFLNKATKNNYNVMLHIKNESISFAFSARINSWEISEAGKYMIYFDNFGCISFDTQNATLDLKETGYEISIPGGGRIMLR